MAKVILYLAALALGIIFIFPYAIMFLTALKPYSEVYILPPTLAPVAAKFSNFIDIWRYVDLALYIRNTILISLGATVVATVCAIPAAYALARLKFPGQRLYLYLVLATQMFSPVVLVIGLYREMIALNLVDTLWSLVLTNAAFNQAFAIWILSGYFSTIPAELEQAAWIDGCSRWDALRRVVLPLAAPGIVTAVIFVFIAAWNEFAIAMTLISSGANKPLTLGIYAFIGKYNVQWQYLCAASLVAVVPVFILFLYIEKYLVSGLTAGAVK